MNDFELFWKVYPKKQAKKDALKAWAQVRIGRPPVTELILAVQKASKTDQWMKGFIPHAATWLRGERWADEYTIDLPNVVNEKPWWDTATGIEKKGAEFGLSVHDFPSFPVFKQEVFAHAKPNLETHD